MRLSFRPAPPEGQQTKEKSCNDAAPVVRTRSLLSKYKISLLIVVALSALILLTLSYTYSEVFSQREYVGTIVVGVIAAKESSYVEEWLAHHFYYGIDKIVIFDDNHPSDLAEKEAMRRVCASFGDRCEIEDFNQYDEVACVFASPYLCSSCFMPSQQGTSYSALAPTRRQGMAMKEFYYYKDNYRRYQWVMMFDVDEFLITKDVHTRVPEVLQRLPHSVHGVHVVRYTFGTDNHTTRPEGGVRGNYCWREKHLRNAKGMARPSEVWAPGLSNHYYTTRSLLTYEGLTNMPKFIPVPSVKDYPGSKAVQFSGGVEGVVKSNHLYIDPSVLVLNHYLTKSVQEHLERRSRPSLNYLYKLKDVYRDDKTITGKYNRHQCGVQKLWLLPSLLTAADLHAAEHDRHSNNTASGVFRDSSAVPNSVSADLTTGRRLRRVKH